MVKNRKFLAVVATAAIANCAAFAADTPQDGGSDGMNAVKRSGATLDTGKSDTSANQRTQDSSPRSTSSSSSPQQKDAMSNTGTSSGSSNQSDSTGMGTQGGQATGQTPSAAGRTTGQGQTCLLYTSDAADE